ncbi:hypothetical protein C9374_002501 [Naegleria lovaniensis]|uniref:Cytochrome P450 n=1 Tax=Naegleria lovaniensis TaxID=51637 RepID=A0AA88KQT4_NAELO|nr:uncharacterized protein C9374_002501 [Naegleria lovaniensis]KAG2386757.1 hypothetical protein C9374_002501 [Naegleria lovaniensis]
MVSSSLMLPSLFGDLDPLLSLIASIGILLFVLVLILVLERYYSYRKLCQKYEHLPGYTQFLPPMVAALLPSWLLPEGTLTNPSGHFLMDQMKSSTKQFKTDHYKVIFGFINLVFIVVTNPEMGKEIATKGAKLYKKTTQSKRTFKELFDGSNIFAEDDHNVWSHQRHLIEPSFAPESLRMVAHVTEETLMKDMIPYLNEHLKQREVMSEFAKLTMDVIGKAGFSYCFDSFHNSASSGHETLEQKTNFFLQYVDALRIVPTRFLRKHLKVGLYAKLHDSVDSFQRLIMDIIRKRELEEGSSLNHEDKSDILSLLLRDRKSKQHNGGSLTDAELVSNAFVLLVAGHETTARTLGFSLYLLSKNPHIQEELHRFVDTFCKTYNKETFDYEDFHSGRLDYIKAVFRETLRLYPVAIGVVRELMKTIEWHNQPIPKGSLLVYSWVLSMTSDEYWEYPNEFKPTRFLQAEGKSEDPVFGQVYNPQTNPFVYTPFGIGGRICIGKHFAEVEGVIALAYLARNYSFQLSDPNYKLNVDMKVTLRPTEPLLVDFIKRR